MAIKVPVSLQYTRAEGRADFERARRTLQGEFAGMQAEAAAAALAELAGTLDSGVARIKRELLGSALCWNEDNQRLAAWIQEQNRRLADMGEQLAFASARRPGDFAARIVAFTLLHRGEALKWLQGRARRDYAPLHGLYAMMREAGGHRASVNVVSEGRGRSATIEGLYLRALLLDRFASGNLTRVQLELLDAWLWEWMPRLVGRDARPDGACLRADLDANAGLREGSREDQGPALYLPLATLEALCRAVLSELHHGRIVPAHGCASEMRIEEHVAVLDRLRRAFDPASEARERRAQRRQAPGTKVEVWVGLAEILRHGAGVGGGTRSELPALSLVESPLVAKQGKLPPPRTDGMPDPTLRYLWQSDVSATGFGFEALESDAAGLEVGEIVGWRREADGPCVLGKVTRRLASTTDGQVFIGVHLLSDAAQPCTLRCATAFGEGASHTFLYVPGDDASGRRDAFLVPESTFEEPSAYEVRIEERKLTVRLNRMRARGRGWVLAGFEVLPVRESAPAASPRQAPVSGELELVLDEDLLDRALSREVGSRLLS